MKSCRLIHLLAILLLLSNGKVAASEFGSEAIERGEYWVCPDGRAAKNDIFFSTRHNFWSMDWGRSGSARTQVKGISAQIFIGKAVNLYTKGEIDAIYSKFLYSQVDTPAAYRSVSVSYDDANLRTNMRLTNNDGKFIKFSGSGTYGSITDSTGRQFDKETDGVVSAIYCPNGQSYMIRRIVERLTLKASDQYGRAEDLPLIFMVTNFYVLTSNPNSTNVPSF